MFCILSIFILFYSISFYCSLINSLLSIIIIIIIIIIVVVVVVVVAMMSGHFVS